MSNKVEIPYLIIYINKFQLFPHFNLIISQEIDKTFIEFKLEIINFNGVIFQKIIVLGFIKAIFVVFISFRALLTTHLINHSSIPLG